MSSSLPHVYGRIKLEEDAFISCHHCDFTSYTFKGFSLHLRKVHGMSLTGKPPRRNKPRPPKATASIEGTTSENNTVAPGPLPVTGLQQLANTMNSSTSSTSSSSVIPEAAVEAGSQGPVEPSMADACVPAASVHVVSQQEEMIKRLVAKREAARVRRAVRRGLRMRPSYGDGSSGVLPGHIEVSFACDRCNFTATNRKDFQTHVTQRSCH
ncbi:uncharacterized protein LOC111269605 [Varroa jacobsoni]|uniref:C2H2-type domain-containing protein n=1 Tax=Varroa destructor TaxID=109461 RepID=A0A7M7KWZ4_VARDE|nr:uncharacterized protein LOC111254029 [Varroa destructor]XP_022670194.1 uncharacterized protein LOC111254029 [Varroa destructor]XP_022670195.1 uncharacterized protein LOC111254029 [Varroa destructor]XP_022670196.1 uncharacterized protein LOC111254029 [Varroa destructor]XP_022670197.1 uncharacterized protein LOC111254029 [Varroa destructor]XP_022705068.1 uncharacterized protein LOC111269605 [Varroa jacobsoni]XP_022705069.1 uncharacterized protein LOC111269605 [Varroa jacobsoni]